MNKKLNRTDSRRIIIIEKFLKNANHQLRKKSIEEIKDIFEFQEKIIKGISDMETREFLLKEIITLKERAILSQSKFQDSIKNLENCEKLLKWKNLEEIRKFFDRVDKDISIIPDLKMRQLLLKQSDYWRKNVIENTEISSMEKRIEAIKNNHSLAWKTEDEINEFFDELDFDIFKMDNFFELNKNLYRKLFLSESEMLRDEIIMKLK